VSCIEIAGKFLRPYIEFFSFHIDTIYDEADELCKIKFTQHIGACKTTDCAAVVITTSGALYSYSPYMLSRIAKETVNNFDMAKIEISVSNQLYEIYSGIQEKYGKAEHKILDTKFTLSDDRNSALLYTFKVSLVNIAEDYKVITKEKGQLLIQDKNPD